MKGKLSDDRNGGLFKFQCLTIESIEFQYNSDPYEQKANMIGAVITKIAGWDVDFSLSYRTSDNQIEAVARTEPKTGIDVYVSDFIRLKPFKLILDLDNYVVGLKFGIKFSLRKRC